MITTKIFWFHSSGQYYKQQESSVPGEQNENNYTYKFRIQCKAILQLLKPKDFSNDFQDM